MLFPVFFISLAAQTLGGTVPAGCWWDWYRTGQLCHANKAQRNIPHSNYRLVSLAHTNLLEIRRYSLNGYII